MIGGDLATAMEHATRALDGDDVVAAAAALRDVARDCEEALRADLRLDGDQLLPLQQAHGRCRLAAERARARLAQLFGMAGAARRAVTAYR